jgi:predicted ATPase
MIQYIEIENFKCFSIRRVNLSRITILAGANSAGKSSVIQSFLLSRIAFERLKAINYKVEGSLTIPLNGDYLLALGNTQEVLNRDSGKDNIRFAFQGEEGSIQQFSFQGDSLVDSAYELSVSNWSNRPIYTQQYSLFAPQFHYLNAERIGPRAKYEAGSSAYPTVGYQGEYSVQVLSNREIKVAEARTRDFDAGPSLLAQTRAWMSFIVPGVNIDDANLYGKIKTAEVSFSKSSPTNVGFGVSYVLPIVVAGLIAPKGCMLIIENPEAHLHPSGQSRIGQFLAKVAAAGVQVIIETHSEHVINGIRIATLDKESKLKPDDALVNFFSRTDDGKPSVTTIHFTSKGDLDQWPRDFFDQQQQDFARIIRLKNQHQQNG